MCLDDDKILNMGTWVMMNGQGMNLTSAQLARGSKFDSYRIVGIGSSEPKQPKQVTHTATRTYGPRSPKPLPD